MAKLLPILLGLIGLGAGVGAGIALKPAPVPVEINPCAEPTEETGHVPDYTSGGQSQETEPTGDFVKLNNQFVVPVLHDGSVDSLVILSLSLEVSPDGSEAFYQREPKLRDAFLQVLFDHANAGGFDGVFTNGGKLAPLRRALLESARKTMGPVVIDVLVTDIVRQDI